MINLPSQDKSAAAAAKSLQSCPTLCDPIDRSPPGSYVHGILQARILSGLSCPPSGDLPNPGTELRSPALQADSLASESPGKPHNLSCSSQLCLLYNEICSACLLSCFSCVCLFATVWTVTHQAPLSMGFSRQENRSA